MKRAIESDHPSFRWQALVSTAVLGADRAGAGVSTGAVPWSLQSSGESDAVRRLLGEAAALSIYELAGREAGKAEGGAARIEPCKADSRLCSSVAARHLAEIVHGDRGALLAEWAAAAVAAEQVAPPELTPAILQHAQSTNDDSLRRALKTVAGERGRWLAGYHPEWQALYSAPAADDPVERWDVGSRAERLAVLRDLRSSNPGTARDMLAATWKQETAEDRAAMLEVFSIGLRSEDEAFLETRLDDRSKQVKAVAARLLSALPGSALSKRMNERVATCVRYLPGERLLLKRKPKLEITLPQSADAAMKRDGLKSLARVAMGAKASLLNRIVAHTSLDWWDSIEPSPAAWIDAASGGEWDLPLIDGWMTAAVAQRNPRWAESLLTDVCLVTAGKQSNVTDDWRRDAVTPLMSSLTRESAETIAIAALKDWKSVPPACVPALLQACTLSWRAELTSAVISMLLVRLDQKDIVFDNPLRELMTRVIAVRVDPSAAGPLVERLPAQADHWSDTFRDVVTALVDTVRFRREMLAALSTND